MPKPDLIDILDRFQFFMGQRAGRELWNEKPREVQDEDLAAYNRDIAKLREAVKSMPGWISVKDRLPEEGKRVLIYSKDGGVAEGCWAKNRRGGMRWMQFRWSAIFELGEVTHWMPLPEPPTNDEEE